MRHSFHLRKILVIGCVAMFVFMVSFVLASVALNFTKHPGPVLSYGGPGAWDDFSVSFGSVLIDEGMYKMWYVGTNSSSYTSAFGYATSNDGITWTRYLGNPIFEGTPGGWDAHLNSVKVIRVGDTYLMYYGGGASGSSPSRIGLATSPDGIHWNSYAENPILTNGPAGSWDEYYVGAPSVIYHGSLFHMWYLGTQGGPHRIGYATSTDGINWTKHAGYPVLTGNTSFQIDYATIPEVVWDGSRYVMLYMSVAIGASNSSTWVAFSDDGVNWQQESVPVITGENPAEWDHLYDIPSGRAVVNDGKYKLWYNTYDGTHGLIGYAEASLEKLTVAIDIKPGSNNNPINLKSNGVIPVAILTTDDFDATTVDPLTVEFGPNSAKETHHKGHIEDAEGDGDLDLILHFKTQETGIQCGDIEASLVGKTFDGMSIVGIDAIQTIGCGLPKSMAAEEKVGFPEGYALSQNYPNPFNPETEIRFQLSEANHVVVKIFNTLGHEIRTLVDAPYEAGYHNIRWDGKDRNGNPLPSGIYLYQLQAGHFQQIKKMSLLR